MRAVVQRVSHCEVQISGALHARIEKGLLIFLGIEEADDDSDLAYLIEKIVKMRIFADSENKMNLSVQDVQGELMIVSQFTLHASTKKGNRPSFIKAAKPEIAIPLYEKFVSLCKSKELKVETGVFGADMQISLLNDGPVTITLDSKAKE